MSVGKTEAELLIIMFIYNLCLNKQDRKPHSQNKTFDRQQVLWCQANGLVLQCSHTVVLEQIHESYCVCVGTCKAIWYLEAIFRCVAQAKIGLVSLYGFVKYCCLCIFFCICVSLHVSRCFSVFLCDVQLITKTQGHTHTCCLCPRLFFTAH